MNPNRDSPEIIRTIDLKSFKLKTDPKVEEGMNGYIDPQLTLKRMLSKHQTDVQIHNNQYQNKAELEYGRDNFQRTTSMISYLSGVEEDEIMTNKYRYITASVLWFCYFSLALNDYIFGPTFDDLSKILGVSFASISYFPIIRQIAYTIGAFGGIGFNYMNRQLALIVLLIVSAFTLIVTPFSPSLAVFWIIGAVNGFAAGACDIGFHVWIIEMFEDGGGPLLQALHFAFGIGITIAPSITSAFLSGGESECTKTSEQNEDIRSFYSTNSSKSNPKFKSRLHIPYTISASIVGLGAIALLVLYCYKKYVPPKEPKAPKAFDQQMPEQLTRQEKFEIWKNSVPSHYMIGLILLGSLLLCAYYGLEVTYFQFMAQFVTSTPLPISGSQSANVESATGGAYALGGAISIYLSTRLLPSQMLYFNFAIINIGNVILYLFSSNSMNLLWVGNVLIGLGFSSTYASIYTFLEHQINVTNGIGSIFLFAGGLGTAILPVFLSKLCENYIIIIILSLCCTQISIITFFILHVMTKIRSKEVDMIKKQLVKSPAILLGWRPKTLSILSV